MPTSPTKRRPRTVAALLDGALHAFAERGFDGASIGYICATAGLTTGAFYSNFESKQDLFFALYDSYAANLLSRFEDLTEQAEHRPELLDELIGAAIEQGSQDQRWHLVSREFGLFAARHPGAAHQLRGYEQRVRGQVAALLDRALRAAGRTPVISMDELARVIIALHDGLALQRGSVAEPDTVARRVLPRILRALSEG